MADVPPDRLSNNPRSPFFQEDVLKRDIGVRFNGVEKTNVEEYCISENWIRVEVGKTKDRYGNPMTIKLTGKVEPYFKDKKVAEDAKPDPAAEPVRVAEPVQATERAKAGPADAAAKPRKADAVAKSEKPAKPEKTSQTGKAEKPKPAKPGTTKKKK